MVQGTDMCEPTTYCKWYKHAIIDRNMMVMETSDTGLATRWTMVQGAAVRDDVKTITSILSVGVLGIHEVPNQPVVLHVH